MDKQEAIQILSDLCDGIDPKTGGDVTTQTILDNPKIIQAFLLAKHALNNPAAGPLKNSGKFWTPKEEQNLIQAFESGKSLDQIAIDHQRTRGAIETRLVRLGKVADHIIAATLP